jgi:hypothetical protein
MQQEAIEVGMSSTFPVRLTETLTPGSTIGHGTVHHREGGSTDIHSVRDYLDTF